jgi:hypothetical protein
LQAGVHVDISIGVGVGVGVGAGEEIGTACKFLIIEAIKRRKRRKRIAKDDMGG